MVRRYSWTVAFTGEDVGCAIAAHTYGWERATDMSGTINFMNHMSYAADEKAAVEVLPGLPSLEMDKDPIAVYSPLEWTKIDPDVILIYVNPAQLMRLIHVATHRTRKSIESCFSGRAASCTEGVLGAFLDKTLKVVVPGNGAEYGPPARIMK